MADDIEATIARKLRAANDDVRKASVAYAASRRRRAEVFARAAELLSQKQVADLAGVTQQRVSQVVQEAAEREGRGTKKAVPKAVARKAVKKSPPRKIRPIDA
jgi:DNA-binding transcriptional MocR family regulator